MFLYIKKNGQLVSCWRFCHPFRFFFADAHVTTSCLPLHILITKKGEEPGFLFQLLNSVQRVAIELRDYEKRANLTVGNFQDEKKCSCASFKSTWLTHYPTTGFHILKPGGMSILNLSTSCWIYTWQYSPPRRCSCLAARGRSWCKWWVFRPYSWQTFPLPPHRYHRCKHQQHHCLKEKKIKQTKQNKYLGVFTTGLNVD